MGELGDTEPPRPVEVRQHAPGHSIPHLAFMAKLLKVSDWFPHELQRSSVKKRHSGRSNHKGNLAMPSQAMYSGCWLDK